MLNSAAGEDFTSSQLSFDSATSSVRPKRRSRAKIDNRKRAFYVTQACNSCKSRKTKCDGKDPCENCRKRSLDCQYAKAGKDEQDEGLGPQNERSESNPLEESKPIGLHELTELVSGLQKKVALLERQKPDVPQEDPQQGPDGDLDESEGDRIPYGISPGSPVFAGPTSSNYSLGIARMILEQDTDAKTSRPNFDPELASSASCWEEDDEEEQEPELQQLMATNSSQIHGLQLRDALRLIQVYHECIGVLHPIVDIEALVQQCKTLWQSNYGLAMDQPQPQQPLEDHAQLNLVLAIALLAEGGGSSDIATKIHNDLQPAIAKQMLARSFTLKGQILLLLASFYQVFQDDVRLASRYVAITCRLMLESGLHQRQVLEHRFPQSSERPKILTILSTCLILDRQLNFNAGLPFTLKETDVDIPEVDTLPPYVKAMAAYARIGPPAWAAVTDDRGRLRPRIRDEDFDYLDYQVRCWQDNLPTDLRAEHITKHVLNQKNILQTSSDRATHFLRYILYLRANQFKIVILRPLLFSVQTVRANIKRVKTLAQIANEIIRTIAEMDAVCDLYRKQQPILNVFLSSALSTLFLIYIYGLKGIAPTEDEGPSCAVTTREGINKGLRLIRAYSDSRSSQRLWKKFAGSRGLLSRLGFTVQGMPGSEAPGSVGSGSSTMPSSLPDQHTLDEFSSLPWSDASLTGYTPIEGFDMIYDSRPQQDVSIDGQSPVPIFGINPFLVPGAAGFLYEDAW